MTPKYDPDFARGARGPGSVLGRGAWLNILEIRKAALVLEKRLRAILVDSVEKEHCLVKLDATVCYAESLIGRYDRNGPPEVQSEIGDTEAVLRIAIKHPETFPPGFAGEVKKALEAMKKKKTA